MENQTALQKALFTLADTQYRDFQSKLIPNIPEETVIGVRIPVLRKFAKEYSKSPEAEEFLSTLPHQYYEENLLHGFLLNYISGIEEVFSRLDAFLPFVDNWAVSDTMAPKILKKHKPELLQKIRIWIKDNHTYTIRFGLLMLMNHFLDEDFNSEYLEWCASIKSEEYYVKMMQAWFFATALAKQWDAALPYIKNKALESWTHRKAIQKAIESYRITDAQKETLRSIRNS